MTLIQCSSREKEILRNAIDWAQGNDCFPLYQLDIATLGDYFDMNIPKAFYNFVCSENVNQCKATGAHKTIFKTLEALRNKILNCETICKYANS